MRPDLIGGLNRFRAKALDLIGHHDATHSTFLAGTGAPATPKIAPKPWHSSHGHAKGHPLPRSAPGPARALATHLCRAAREHDT
ncbi:hypothetical protein [Streptomyces albus]|uniref:hypothetical protein n=1 Tax=Streptomyces sp. NRRL F-5639 TaxID=1463867 RepID=UPI0004C61238|nr:hypothetical protein [Streptomyces sp. NRRL F-5639]KPC96708.1 hypothetical protein ADL27_02430 [Streptomyces sp. NRRL F-6602]